MSVIGNELKRVILLDTVKKIMKFGGLLNVPFNLWIGAIRIYLRSIEAKEITDNMTEEQRSQLWESYIEEEVKR